MVSQNIEHWSGYWSQGNITSLPVDFRDNYDREIKHFWFEQFKQLPESAVILDVCTGNGAIALLAAEFSDIHQKNFSIIAVDAASIDIAAIKSRYPQLEPYLNQIQFKPSTRIEELSFDDDSFDLICSQYGIEYCQWDVSSKKFAALLKPGGLQVFVSHAQDTSIIEKMKSEYNEYQVMEPIKFFSRIKKLIRNDASQKELEGIMKEVAGELNKTLMTRVSPVLQSLMEASKFVLTSSNEKYKANRDKLFTFLKSLIHARARLQDLLDVHQRLSAEPEWYNHFAKSGVERIDNGKLVYNNKHPAGDFYIYKKS
jgi:ubiquinone/menaquinone biosynthesis C-methylase UbiE